MNADVMAYIGRCRKCNVIVMACVDKPYHADATADAVAECIRFGDIVERVTMQFVRDNPWGECKCDQPAQLPLVGGLGFEFVATKALADIAEARRLMEVTLRTGGTGPLQEQQ